VKRKKETLKQILTTRKGWFSIIVANIITSLPWFFSFDLLWILNVTVALWIDKIWKNKK
jgi:hypothetical protein